MVPGFLSSCLSLKGGEGPEQILLTDTHGRPGGRRDVVSVVKIVQQRQLRVVRRRQAFFTSLMVLRR